MDYKLFGLLQEECAFSVIHGDNYECLDLIALTPADANIWVTGLMAISGGNINAEELASSLAQMTGPSGANMANLRERYLSPLFIKFN